MQIRPYRAEDLSELVKIFTMAVYMLGRAHYDEAQLKAWAPVPPDLDEWENRLSTLNTLVMEEDACPLGFVSWRDDGYINLIFVRPDATRRGIASRLISAAEAELANVARLHVHASLIARPCFERHGYRVIAEETVTRAGVELKRYEMCKDRPAA